MWAANALFSPMGRIGLAALAFVLWTAYQRADATANCRDAQALADLQAANAMLTEAKRIAEESRARAEAAEEHMATMEAEKDELLSDFERRGTSCPIPADLADRLRAIR